MDSPATSAVDWELSRQEAAAYLEGLQKEVALATGHPVDVRLDQGHPAERIRAIAQEIGADLTVLGTHGEHGATAWHLGSTVHQVLAVARGSVLIVPSSSQAPPPVSPQHILVPLDGSIHTERVLPIALRLAGPHDADVVLIHVVLEPSQTALLRAPEDLVLARQLADHLVERAGRYLEDLRAPLSRDGAKVRVMVARNVDVRQALLDAAKSNQTDLIVLSAHGSTGNAALPIGSVTAHLLAHAQVPALVLQDLQRRPEVAPEHEGMRAPSLRANFSAQNS